MQVNSFIVSILLARLAMGADGGAHVAIVGEACALLAAPWVDNQAYDEARAREIAALAAAGPRRWPAAAACGEGVWIAAARRPSESPAWRDAVSSLALALAPPLSAQVPILRC